MFPEILSPKTNKEKEKNYPLESPEKECSTDD